MTERWLPRVKPMKASRLAQPRHTTSTKLLRRKTLRESVRASVPAGLHRTRRKDYIPSLTTFRRGMMAGKELAEVSRSGRVVSEEATLSKTKVWMLRTMAATMTIQGRETQVDMLIKTSMMPQLRWRMARALSAILARLGAETWPGISLRETTQMEG